MFYKGFFFFFKWFHYLKETQKYKHISQPYKPRYSPFSFEIAVHEAFKESYSMTNEMKQIKYLRFNNIQTTTSFKILNDETLFTPLDL